MIHSDGLWAVALGALIVAGTACGPPAGDADSLRATERERLRALVAGDVTRARPLHADDFQLINPRGGDLSKEQYLGGIASGQIDYLFWEPDSIAVRLYRDAAVIRYPSQLEIVVQGAHIPRQRYWHTDLYERRDGRWQVVWSHATGIQ
ncbi:MAG TPA: nuclear transport factor 2 family protein [Gemmatimonadales bacterium]|nr:nuclear transport factor 2 family protein [Gemmatimonadales bacterium]